MYVLSSPTCFPPSALSPFPSFPSALLPLSPPSFLLCPPSSSALLPLSPPSFLLCSQIQQKRVDCIGLLHSQGEACMKAMVERIMAALHCRGAEMRVDFLMTQYRQAKREYDNAEVWL